MTMKASPNLATMEKMRIQPSLRRSPDDSQERMLGFSLIEMMAVIGIAAILLALGAGAYVQWREDTRIASSKEDIVTILQMARLRAMSRGASQVVTFNWSTDTVSYTTNVSQTKSYVNVDLQGFTCTGSVLKPAGTDTFTFSRRGTVTFSGPQNLRVSAPGGGKMYIIQVRSITGRIQTLAGGSC